MEMNAAKKRHPLRNLSLKWSFSIYVTVCILLALSISAPLSATFGSLQSGIINRYLAEADKPDEDSSDAQVSIYTVDIRSRFTARDAFLYFLYNTLAILIVPVVFMVFIVTGGALFYRRKLKKPLAILDAASGRIASGDLDFTVEYDSRNEFGRLAASFETMRRSLYETNRDMWRMMEGRRRLNAAFAHDLRTPLTVLRGYSDFLLKYAPSGKIGDEKAMATLSTMDVYLKRLEGYTTTMSSLQKLDEIELSPTEVSFRSFIRLHAPLNAIASLSVTTQAFQSASGILKAARCL